MKVTTNKAEVKPLKPFPKLMIHEDGTIVLFQKFGNGICLIGCNTSDLCDIYTVGDGSDGWHMSKFSDLPTGFSVTITQE